MIEKKQIISYNDGSGLYDTAGILRAAVQDINALILQGVANWTRAAGAIGKIESAIRAVEARDREDEAAAAAEEARQAEQAVKVVDFRKGSDDEGGGV